MNPHSHVISVLNEGLILNVVLGGLDFTAYVVISDPDVNRVAELIPQEHYDRHGDVHVIAIQTADEANEQINEIAFHMNPGDAAVLLCQNKSAYIETLRLLGQQSVAAD